jgi:hypothetical protein
MVIGPGSVNLKRREVWARAKRASSACTGARRRIGPVTVGQSAS